MVCLGKTPVLARIPRSAATPQVDPSSFIIPPPSPGRSTYAIECRVIAAMEWISDPQIWISLATLTLLEIVLGIDNIIFLSILAGKLPAAQQPKARFLGLAGALVMRLILLGALSWIIKLTTPLFSVFGHEFSGQSLVLLSGGLFLIWKSTHEIHHKLEGEEEHENGHAKNKVSFVAIVGQIMVLDIIFSLDSVITAVGMVQHLPVMVAAVVIAIIVMMFAAGTIADFVNRHPTVTMLALSFLLLVGLVLVADGLGHHIPKGYIYFAMAFSILVEVLNLRAAAKRKAKRALHPA